MRCEPDLSRMSGSLHGAVQHSHCQNSMPHVSMPFICSLCASIEGSGCFRIPNSRLLSEVCFVQPQQAPCPETQERMSKWWKDARFPCTPLIVKHQYHRRVCSQGLSIINQDLTQKIDRGGAKYRVPCPSDGQTRKLARGLRSPSETSVVPVLKSP